MKGYLNEILCVVNCLRLIKVPSAKPVIVDDAVTVLEQEGASVFPLECSCASLLWSCVWDSGCLKRKENSLITKNHVGLELDFSFIWMVEFM